MQHYISFFSWLDGKKTFIGSFLTLTISFLSLKHLLDQDTAAYMNSLVALFASGAEVATVKLGARMGAKK